MATINLNRLEYESDLEYVYRICSNKEQIGTWDDVGAIINQVLHQDKSANAWRKKYAYMCRKEANSIVTTSSPVNENMCNDSSDNSIDAKIRELERKKIAYRDQRNAWQKQNYSDARLEENLEMLTYNLSKIARIEFPNIDVPSIDGNNEMIICLSDLHIGQTFSNVFGEYNTDIAANRLAQYLAEVKRIAKLHKVKKAHIVCLGDLISGSIHKTIQVTNRENVIEQIKIAVTYISNFCYECCQLFEQVNFYNASGNHTRIDKKDEALHDERLDDLIGWTVGLALYNVQNFNYMKHRNLDIGICDLNVAEKTYLAVHGDFDAMTKSGVSDLSMMIGFVPYAILRGHMHYPAMTELNGVKMIQSGSLAGSGDEHTIEKRLVGNPSQTILVCNSKGIECIYHTDLR